MKAFFLVVGEAGKQLTLVNPSNPEDLPEGTHHSSVTTTKLLQLSLAHADLLYYPCYLTSSQIKSINSGVTTEMKFETVNIRVRSTELRSSRTSNELVRNDYNVATRGIIPAVFQM